MIGMSVTFDGKNLTELFNEGQGRTVPVDVTKTWRPILTTTIKTKDVDDTASNSYIAPCQLSRFKCRLP